MTQRCLIAISTCWDFEKNGNNGAARQTWMAEAVKLFDVRFFVGKGQGAETAELPADTILLPDVEDDYAHLTSKTQDSIRWAHPRGYDFIFHCCADTYLVPSLLLTCGFEETDYMGHFRGEQLVGNYANGGPGYFLSRKAFSLLLDAPIAGVFRQEIIHWAEDLWVGQILAKHNDLIYRDDWARFVNHGSRYFPTRANGVIASHLSCPDGYNQSMMLAAHQSWLHS